MIKAFDYRRELARYRREIDEALARVLDSGALILGPEVTAFEQEFAESLGSRAAVAVASGTDSLILALRALEIGPGDEVVTVANTTVPTAAAIRSVGAAPRFLDVDDESLLMTAETLVQRLSPRTRAIIAVHLYGAPVLMPEILEMARERNIAVIGDCAHAHGGLLDNRHLGTFADIGCFSFYPTKNLGAYGDGGICVTDHPHLAQQLRVLRNYGSGPDKVARLDGYNSRLDEIQAAILRVKLRHLDEAMAERRALADLYRQGLSGTEFRMQSVPERGLHAYHQFIVRSSNREKVLRRLEQNQIGYGIHYDPPLHLMPAFRPYHASNLPLPVAEAAAREVISLPLYPGLTADEVMEVIRVLRGE
jgi:dTDP-4-amino-4,6-dideoxygalactose transaminase